MATVLTYVMNDAYTSERGEILAEFRASDEVRRLFERGVIAREALRATPAATEEQADASADD
jgi:hypothetical protein